MLGREFKTIGTSRSLSSIEGQDHKEVILQGDYYHLAIVSHCCEFNEGKRAKFLVARLQTVRGDLSSEQLEAVRLSNDIEARAEAGEAIDGLDGFLFEPVPGQFDQPMVASFQTITPIPTSMADSLKSTKRAELEHDVRVQFRRKLGFFFGREADDVPEDEKAPAPESEH